MRFGFVVFACVVLPSAVNAEVSDYCAAYARDIADQVDASSPQWQRRHDNAEAYCNDRFAAVKVTAQVTPPREKPKVIAKPKPKPVVAEIVEPASDVSAQTVRVVPQLKAGSPEWRTYCKNKYVSFNDTTGTYTSRTGVERKCLVTAE